MLTEMRPSELGMWAAFYAVDPWTEERADLRAGTVAAVIANVHRSRDREPFEATDFMPFREKKKPSMAQRMRAFLLGRPRQG